MSEKESKNLDQLFQSDLRVLANFAQVSTDKSQGFKISLRQVVNKLFGTSKSHGRVLYSSSLNKKSIVVDCENWIWQLPKEKL